MQIRSVHTDSLHLPVEGGLSKPSLLTFPCLLVRVETADGVTGAAVLYSMNAAFLPVLAAAVSAVGTGWVDRTIEDIDETVKQSFSSLSPFGPEGIVAMAVSAVERACWDALARSKGVAVSELLGRVRDDVPVYASGLWLYQTVDELVASARRFVETGFRAIKMRIGRPHPREDIERVRAVREAIGSSIALMVDANERYSVQDAIDVGHRLEPYDLAWIEEPVDAHDLGGCARVAERLDTPIALGEHAFLARTVHEIVRRRAADILMPDLGRIGGLSELRRVADCAAENGLGVTPHSYPYESIQAVASIHNATYVEYLPWFDQLYLDRLAPEEGTVHIPDAAGFGFTIDDAAVDRSRRASQPRS